MKKTNKKGFTLVELLVVIAILAILATVSVVGYTAFIERATVSNDENVAAQLNQFLTAMKADSTGKYYNEPITPDNVWEVINAALEDNGTLTELEPQSLDYGYHYFYKFSKNEAGNYVNGEIVVAKTDDIIKNASKGFLARAVGATNETDPGFFIVGEGDNQTLYFLLDTKGSSLAIAVRGFHTLDGISWDDFKKALDESQSEQDNKIFASNKVFITSDGNKTIDGKGGKTESITHKNVQKITTDGDDDLSGVTGDIDVPDSVKVIGNDVLAKINTSLVIGKTSQEIAGMLSEHNENGNKEITVKIGENTTVTIKVESNKNYVVDGENTTSGTFTNPVQSVTIKVEQVTDKVKTLDNTTYIAWDYALSNNIKFKIDPVGEDDTLPASYEKVEWKLGEANATDSIKFTNKDDQTVSVSVDGKPATAEIKFVYIIGVSGWKLDSENLEFDNDGNDSVEIVKSITDNTAFKLDKDSQKFTYQNYHRDIKLDETIAITEESNDKAFTINGLALSLANGKKDLTNAKTIKITVGGYFERELSLKIFNADNLTFKVKYDNLKYVGDDNPITLGNLFELNDNMEMPNNAIVMFRKTYGDASITPGNFTYSEVTNSQNSDLITISSTGNADIPITTLAQTSLQFKGGSNSETKTVSVFIAVPTAEDGVYRRISKAITLNVVDAWNIDGTNPEIEGEYVFKTDSFTGTASKHEHSVENCKDSTKGAHETIEHNLVLLSDYKFTTGQYFGLYKSILYGNLFTLDVTDGRNNSTGIVELVGSTMKDTIVKAKEYDSTNDPWWKKGMFSNEKCHVYDKEYSAAAVRVYGTESIIDNCYISGARSAVRVEVADTTIKNTVLFGGAYANLDIQNATKVNVENVVTVNQYQYIVDGETVNAKCFGGGVIFANATTGGAPLYITGKKGLMQFNLMSNDSDEVQHIIDEGTVSVSDIVTRMDGIYYILMEKFKFTYNSKSYFNAGILSLKTGSNDTGTSLKICVNDNLALPNGYSIKSNQGLSNDTAVSVATFDNSEMNYETVKSAFNDQYGFDFSIENLIKEASKYHPDNIGKDGNYKLEYKD